MIDSLEEKNNASVETEFSSYINKKLKSIMCYPFAFISVLPNYILITVLIKLFQLKIFF